MLNSIRTATAVIQRLTGSANRPSYGESETFPVYWEEDSQTVTGTEGNVFQSVGYGDFAIGANLKIGDKIVSVTETIDTVSTMLLREETIKKIGRYPRFNRLEVYV